MKNIIKHWYYIVLIAIVLSFLSVRVFTLPYSIFDISTDGASNIANTINGLSAPILSIITIALVFLTFADQRRFIREQQNELGKQDLYQKSAAINNEFKELIEIVNEFETDRYVQTNNKGSFLGVEVQTIKGLTALNNYVKSIDGDNKIRYYSDYLHLEYFLKQLIICIEHINNLPDSTEKTGIELKFTNLITTKFIFINELIQKFSFHRKANEDFSFPFENVLEDLITYKLIYNSLFFSLYETENP